MDLNERRFINYLLLPVAGIFWALNYIRKWFYQIGIFKTHRFDIPIIVVGNITVGGTGKTPIVIKLIEHFQKKGEKVGVVSRGYGGSQSGKSLLVDAHTQVSLSGDEPLLIATLTDAPVMVNKNRSQAVQDLITQYQPTVVISDDGLQHYAMARDIEIAVVDGQRRFGNGFFLPAGSLREPRSRLKLVDFVINNGSVFPAEISAQLKSVNFVHILSNKEFALDFFKNQPCHGVAGIGHPKRFFNTLRQLNIQVVEHYFADHYRYRAHNLEFEDNYPIIMTAKDWVKCRKFANDKMYYLKVDLDISTDFLTQLETKL